MDNIDWVEQVTGERGPSWCDRHGHRKVRVSAARDVNGHPAAYYECRVCGLRGFHWIGSETAAEYLEAEERAAG